MRSNRKMDNQRQGANCHARCMMPDRLYTGRGTITLQKLQEIFRPLINDKDRSQVKAFIAKFGCMPSELPVEKYGDAWAFIEQQAQQDLPVPMMTHEEALKTLKGWLSELKERFEDEAGQVSLELIQKYGADTFEGIPQSHLEEFVEEFDQMVHGEKPAPVEEAEPESAAKAAPEPTEAEGEALDACKAFGRGFTDLIPLRGKVPVQNKWTNTKTEDALDVLSWVAEGYNVGLLTKNYPAVDIDVLDPKLSALIQQITKKVLGDAPTRVGKAPKAMLFYRADAAFPKRSLTLQKAGVTHEIEILGDGQQAAVAGEHPDTGKQYLWYPPLHEMEPSDLTPVDEVMIEQFFAMVKKELTALGWTVTEGSSSDHHEVDLESLRAPSVDMVRELVEKMPNPAEMSRDDQLKMAHAIKGAVGPENVEDGRQIFMEWSQKWDGDVNPDHDEHIYRGIRNPHTGWKRLLVLATESDVDTTEQAVQTAQAEFEPIEGAEDIKSPMQLLFDEVAAVPEDPMEARNYLNSTLVSRLRHFSQEALVSADREGDNEIALSTVAKAVKRLGITKPALRKMSAPENIPEADIDLSTWYPEMVPWPTPVDGAVLLEEIISTLKKYVVLPHDDYYRAVALWVLHAACVNELDASPMLAITSPTKGCGKTRLLEVIGAMLYRATQVSNLTSAALFRVVEMYKPVMLIDEMDAFAEQDEVFRGLLNCGVLRTQAYVVRLVGDNHEPKKFSTFGAKVVAKIGELDGTVADRSICVRMGRKTNKDKVERWLAGISDGAIREDVGRKVLRWAEDNAPGVAGTHASVLYELENRAADIWGTLMDIAEVIGGSAPAEAKEMALHLGHDSKEVSKLDASLDMLEDVRTVFMERGVRRISLQGLANALQEMDHRPWNAFGKFGRPIIGQDIGLALRTFGVKASRMKFNGVELRGLRRSALDEVWDRYLDPYVAEEVDAVGDEPTTTSEVDLDDLL